MKVIGIVGYRKSGKTNLGVKLCQELAKRGYRVGVVKHIGGSLDTPGKDTALYAQFCDDVVAVGKHGMVKFLRRSTDIEQAIQSLETDILIVEGLKKEKTFPRIVCLRNKQEEKKLSLGLRVATVGEGYLDPEKDISRIADLVISKAFKLPNLNCGACGFSSCYELAKAIVKGKKKDSDCVRLGPAVEVEINDRRLELNPFVSDLLVRTIKGFLSGLKGFTHGKIRIKIDEVKLR